MKIVYLLCLWIVFSGSSYSNEVFKDDTFNGVENPDCVDVLFSLPYDVFPLTLKERSELVAGLKENKGGLKMSFRAKEVSYFLMIRAIYGAGDIGVVLMWADEKGKHSIKLRRRARSWEKIPEKK